MERLPHLEESLRLAYEARDEAHAAGVALSSYFARAKTRGRRRSEIDGELVFPPSLRARLGPALEVALDAGSWRACASARPADPIATRHWLAEGALALGKAEGPALMWALLRAVSELESVAQKLISARGSRATVREVLHGVGPRTLRAEPFAALVVRVLKIAQAVYVAFRQAGLPHEGSWAEVEHRLWSPHPTGRRDSAGAEARGAYLPSLVQAASGNARKRLRRNAEAGRTVAHAQALLARFATGPGPSLWPWLDDDGAFLPQRAKALGPEDAGACFFVLLTAVADQRRSRGGPSGGLSQPFEEAGFAAPEWLPDRTDDLAVRLLAAAGTGSRAGLLEALPPLLRGTLEGGRGAMDEGQGAMIDRARKRLFALLHWLEENGRELLETP